MVLKPVVDRCHICGNQTQLTFEHIPPRQAFNNTGVLLAELELDKPLSIGRAPVGTKKFQKGMGSYTLCQRCNNETGAWYGSRFVDFCKKGLAVLKGSNYRPTLYYFMDIYPLAILKQLASMFLSINTVSFRDKYADLPAFVLNKERRFLDPKYRVYIYFNHGGMHRATPIVAKVDFRTATLAHVRTSFMTEISFPPFGYLMTIDSDPPDRDIVDITYFSRYAYDQVKTLSMDYPVYPTHTFFPGDYRSVEQIAKDIKQKGGLVP